MVRDQELVLDAGDRPGRPRQTQSKQGKRWSKMISIYADGSSSGGSGRPGGYGWVIARNESVISWGYGGSTATTNNLMEAEGAIQGMIAALELGIDDLHELVCDSQYVLGIASGGYAPTKNLEQAQQLVDLAAKLGCRFRWVRGHAGDTFNEKCDKLAKQGKVENTDPADIKPKGHHKKARREKRKAMVAALDPDSE